MDCTLAVKKVIDLAEEVVISHGKDKTHHEDILMGICQLANSADLLREIEPDESNWLKDMFDETGIDSENLYNLLYEIYHVEGTNTAPYLSVHTTQYHDILEAAGEHAQEEEENRVQIQHLISALINHYDRESISLLKNAIKTAGGNWNKLQKYIGQHPGDAGPFSIGQQIGYFDIQEVIGKGGMGVVYLAYDNIMGQNVAIKTLLWDKTSNYSDKECFADEVEVWLDLIHPHIVKALQILHPDKTTDYNLAVVMEYFPYGTLRDHYKELNLLDVLDVAIQICWAMEFVHKTFMHLDLKPENILLDEQHNAFVSDFGIVATSNSGFGTAPYMPPEQWEGKASKKSDIYAFGVLLFEIICNRLPFGRLWKENHLEKPPPNPRDFRPEIPESLSKLILECLAKKPSERPADFGKIARHLIKIYKTFSGKPYKKHRRKPTRNEISKEERRAQGWKLLRVGFASRLNGNLIKAEHQAKKALKTFHKIKDSEGYAASLNNIGNISKDKGEYRTALEYYKEALEVLITIGSKRKVAQCYNNTANAFKLCGDYDTAIKMYQESLDMRISLDDWDGMSTCYNNIGGLRLDMNQLDEAEKSYNDCIEICKKHNQDRYLASGYLGLGSVYLHQGKYDESEKILSKALKLSKDVGNKIVETKCYGGFGALWDAKGNLFKAESSYKQSIKIAKDASINPTAAQVCFELADLYNRHEQFNKASDMYLQALDISRQLNDHIIAADCLFNLGVISKRLNNIHEAKSYFEESVVYCEKTNNNSELAGCHLHLAEIYELSGDLVLSFATFHTALRYAIKSGERKLEGICCFNIAIAYSNRMNNSKSKEFYKKTIAIAEEQNDVELLAECYGNLAGIMMSNGDTIRMRQYAQKSISFCKKAGMPVPPGLMALTRPR
jgi:serine/threonine protein kinase/Flp pilus assembly protein TadD